MKLTLISHKLCPFVQRAVIALKEKGVDFERIDIDLSAKPDWFLAVSPLGKTPVLQVDGEAIFESSVICEYLDDTFAPPLHPADALQRARHRAWIEFASATLNKLWSFYTTKDAAAFDAASRTLAEHFQQLEKALKEGPYFAGERFSLVDAAFGPVFRYFDVFGDATGTDFFETTPKVRAWSRALAQRPSVQTAVAPDYAERLKEYVIGHHSLLGERLLAEA
ncbi:glutathione S-transferase family protein [Noviherbaspirillum agri]